MNTPDRTPGTAPEVVPVDFADVMDDWLNGASISQVSVPIYGKQHLVGRYQALIRERELVAETLKIDGALGSPELDKIDDEIEVLYAEWTASKSTWYLRGLGDEERNALQAETPPIPDPEPLPKGANPGQVEWHESVVADVAKQREAAREDENLRMIAKALVKIEFADGRIVESVTVDHLRRLHKQLGDVQLSKLAQGVAAATTGDPELPAPFLLRTSQTDQT